VVVRWHDTLDQGGAQAQAVRDRLRRAASAVEATAKPVAEGSSDRARSANGALAAVTIAKATLAAGRDEIDQALNLLSKFRSRHGQAGDLLDDAMRRRLLLAVDAGRLDLAASVAQSMAKRLPNQGRSVIRRALDRLERRIGRKQIQAAELPTGEAEARQRLQREAKRQARVAAQLAQLMFDWARDERGMSGEELLPFRLDLVRFLRLSGQVSQAKGLLEPLMNDERYKNNADVINAWGELLFAQGKDRSLKRAAQHFNRLIQGVEPGNALFWNAWRRRLQINDRLGRETGVIPRRVRQLKQTYDQQLGGEPYRSALQRLADKYRRGG